MAKADDATLVTEHEINITGLSANTKYYYAIGTSTNLLAGPDSNMYFQTSPTAGTKQPIRVWAIGDFGEGNTNQAAVRDAYLNYTSGKHTDVWVWMGDNAYDDGRDNEYQTNVFDMYPNIFQNTVVWPSPGNHDYGSAHPVNPLGAGPYFSNFTMPTNAEAGGTASGDEGYYSFDYGNVHFISINSEDYTYTILLDVVIDHSPTMLTWLQNDLAANTNKDWIIAYLHATPYSEGTHSENYTGADPIKKIDGSVMRAVRDDIVPILESYGVDVFLAGHSHCYERSYLMYGNYGSESSFTPDSTILSSTSGSASDGTPYVKYTNGPDANKGTVYSVIGCSAKIGDLGSDAQLDHPLHYTGAYELGSMVLEINDNRLDAYFIDTTGNVFDEFTIIKDTLNANIAPIANDDLVNTDTSTSVLVNVQLNDGDPNGDPMTTTIVSGPNNGTASVTGIDINYTPNPGFAGIDTIVYSVCDNGNPSLCDTASIIITVTAGYVSVKPDAYFASDLSVFPNPFSGQLKVEYVLENPDFVSLDIYNLTGQKVHTIVNEKQTKGSYSYTIDTDKTGLVKGLYLLQFKTKSSSKVRKTIRL